MSTPYRIHNSGEVISYSPSGTRRVLLPAIAKHNGGRGAAYTIPNEYICGELARFLGLPAPPLTLATHPDGTPCVAALDFNPARHPPVPADIDGCLQHLPAVSAGVMLFDFWIANPDRHNCNLVVDLQASPPQMFIFDHGQALCGHLPGEAILRLALFRDQQGTNSCFLPFITEETHFPFWLARIRSVPDFFIEDLCAAARPYGLTAEECAAAADFLKHRRYVLPDILRASRPAFKSIREWTGQY